MKKRPVTKQKFSYNGWANWETWTIGLWEYIGFLADSALDQGELQVDADWCEDLLYDILDINSYDGIVGDWVSGCFKEVDWREIAEHVNERILERGL